MSAHRLQTRNRWTARYLSEGLPETRYGGANGGLLWHSDRVAVSILRAGEQVGLDEIDNGVRNVWYGSMKIGRLLELHMRIDILRVG